jgi:hypothetical protein
MRTYLIIIFLGLFLAACDKDLKLYDEKEVKGKLILEDNVTEVSGAIASEGLVYLSKDKPYESSDDNYLYYVKADKEGVFSLLYQPRKQDDVKFSAKYTSSTGIVYRREYDLTSLLIITQGVEKVIGLNPVYPKGILKSTWTEGTSSDVKPIVGAEVFLFANPAQAATIGNATPDGVLQKTTTNAKGIALFYGLDKGDYYVAARTKPGGIVAIASPFYTKLVAADVDKDPQIVKSIMLTSPTVSDLPAIDVSVTTTNPKTEPITRFYVYLFSSEKQAQTIADDKVSGYIRMDSTDANGYLRIKNLPLKKYYVGVKGFFAGKTPQAKYYDVDVKMEDTYSMPFQF